jgi:hypothetical protein
VAFDRFPWESYRFSTITLEHDQYRVGTRLRDKIRTRLQSLGYMLVCADVIVPGYGPFEDWFVYPDTTRIYTDRIEAIRCASCPFQEILDKMNAFFSR